MNLTQFIASNQIIKLTAANTELAKQVQTKLKAGNFYLGAIDGIVGAGTLVAFAKFKSSVWLERPDELGKTTALALLELGENTNVSDKADKLPSNPGTKSGATMKLPGGKIVYANELVIPGIAITWGEWTKNCKRVPETNQIVANMISVTKIFGTVRSKYDAPLTVNSGYRPSAINKAIGGASRSQHIQGRALDLSCSNLTKLYQIVKAIPEITGVGSGMHKGFVHLDNRPGDRVYFSYP